MTQTIQPCSWAVLDNAGKDLTVKKSETEDIRSLLLSVFDSLNDLSEKLNRLNYLLTRRNIERGLYRRGKGEAI